MTEYQRQFQARLRAIWNENHPDQQIFPVLKHRPDPTAAIRRDLANPPCNEDS